LILALEALPGARTHAGWEALLDDSILEGALKISGAAWSAFLAAYAAAETPRRYSAPMTP